MNATTTPAPTDAQALKDLVRAKYAEIATQSREQNAASCCGATPASACCSPDADGGAAVYNVMAEDYRTEAGYVPDADLGLGCGIPTQFAPLQPGQTVLDLGSGAGNDAFVARRAVGAQGKVIGVDFTPEMVTRARANADTLGYVNVEFRQGDIEALPVGAASVDVVLSNCVLNLVPDKARAFAEMARVLKPGGYFAVSDIVLEGQLPPDLLRAAELYAGCVSGAVQLAAYLDMIRAAGFEQVAVVKRRPIEIPRDILRSYLDEAACDAFYAAGPVILSVTVKGFRPACCEPGSGCC